MVSLNLPHLTVFTFCLSVMLSDAFKTSTDDLTVISCNDYIPFNYDSQQICLSMQNINDENSCNIILPTSIQINFNEFFFNDKNAKLAVFQGNDERFTDTWEMEKLESQKSPIFYEKNVELRISTSDSKGVVCFTINTIFPLKKSPYKFRFERN